MVFNENLSKFEHFSAEERGNFDFDFFLKIMLKYVCEYVVHKYVMVRKIWGWGIYYTYDALNVPIYPPMAHFFLVL